MQAVTGTVMAAEMAEQPAVLRRLLADRTAIHDAVRRIVPSPLLGFALIGRGSSDNALVFGRYALELAARRPATFVAPSVHALYGVEVDYHGHLALGASQSGRTPEIVAALNRVGASGAATVAMTADPESPLARAADLALDLRTGPELAVPATKTFTAQVTLAALTAEAVGTVPWSSHHWASIPGLLEDVLADVEPVHRAVEALAGAQRISLVGRGFLLAIAREAALKLQEAALIAATPHSAASFRHGPAAGASAAFPVVAFSGPGPAGDDVDRLVVALRARGLPVTTIGVGPGADLPIPPGLPDGLIAFPAAVRAQQLALALAQAHGVDPDAPPGLDKVTLT